MAGGSGDTKDSGAKQDGGDKPASGLPRWAQLSILLLALIFLGFGIWLLVNSQAIVGSANDRNFHNLEVAANGLETWPRDAQTLAANNFNKTRWEDVRGDAPADAFKMVSFNHPQLGRFRIYYLPAAKCDPAPTDPTPASKAAPAPRAPAKSGEEAAGDDFRVFELGRFAGQGPVFQIRQKFATDQGMIDALDAEAKGKAVADANGRLCFQVGVSLDRLIALDRAAPNFSNLLILAADGSVIKQVGKTALPVSKLEKFTPGDALTKSLIQQLTTGKAQDKPADSAAIPLDAVQQAVDLTIADVDYVAYVRPFVLEGRPAACPVTTRKDGTDFGDGSKCYAVALMPKASLRNAWLSPPSALLASFGLLVLIVLALLPLVRLLLIGSTETAGPLEMAGIVLGLQTAAAVATLAILFAADLAEQRTAAQNESTHLAETLAASADGEIKDAIVKMLGIASSPRNAWTDYCWSPKNCGKLAGPQGVVTWQPRPELGLLAPYLPPLWSITYVDGSDSDKRGRPVDGTFTLAATQRMTPRINVRWRDYFIAYTGGRARPLPDLSHRHDLRPEVRANAALLQHTLGQVRSQSDGVNKTILTIGPFAPPARLSFPGERKSAMTDGALVSPLILRTFLSPILPAPHRFLVVDTSQPNLPVLFHSEPERACIDQLGEQVDIDGPVRQALRFPKSSRLVTFMARYDGVLTRFNAVRIGDTDWAVVTFYTLDEVDKIAGGRVAWTLASWGSLAILGMLLFVIWLWLGRGTWRALWPHEKAAPAYRLLSRNLLIAAVAMTAIVWLLPPLYGVFGATLLWVVTIALVGSLALIRPAAMSIKPETERAYRRLVMAMLLCCAAVPMAAIWRDAGVLVAVRADGDRLAAAKTSAEKRQIEGLAIQRSYRDDAKPMPLFGAVLSSPGMVAGPSRLDKTPPSFSTFFWTLSTGLSPRRPASLPGRDGRLGMGMLVSLERGGGGRRARQFRPPPMPALPVPAMRPPQITTSLTTFGVTPACRRAAGPRKRVRAVRRLSGPARPRLPVSHDRGRAFVPQGRDGLRRAARRGELAPPRARAGRDARVQGAQRDPAARPQVVARRPPAGRPRKIAGEPAQCDGPSPISPRQPQMRRPGQPSPRLPRAVLRGGLRRSRLDAGRSASAGGQAGAVLQEGQAHHLHGARAGAARHRTPPDRPENAGRPRTVTWKIRATASSSSSPKCRRWSASSTPSSSNMSTTTARTRCARSCAGRACSTITPPSPSRRSTRWTKASC